MAMVLTLLNIVLPVLAIALLGFAMGRRQARPPEMAFINHANVNVFCPALVFSALLDNPVDPLNSWPLVLGGVLIIVVPGILLRFLPYPTETRTAFIVPGMFRNTGNLGIPLMMLAYGKDQLGDIVTLFVVSNILTFSLGLYLLSRGRNRWMWLRSPNVWAALLGVAFSQHRELLPEFFLTAADLTGQIAIPLMLFGLGVRLSQGRIGQLGLALRINLVYLAVGALTLMPVLWLLPLTPSWQRLLALSVMLPPAVLNYLLSETYRVEPATIANVVLLGNVLSVATVPLVVLATLTWI